MKRISSSDSSGALMSICPTTEEQSPTRNSHVYSREFQSMLEGLDEEGCIEESNQVSEKKRRLSVEQVKALEKNFEVENKLEPDRKVKLAQELGLQTRQVAVWFQNRRARWKTKQLERDYGVLKASYDDLKHNFDKVQHDNEALLKEIRGLKSKLQEENSVESNVSAKEEAMVSQSENKVVEEIEEQQNHQIKTPPLCSSVAKCDDISEMNCDGLGFTNTIKDGNVVVGLGTTAASSSTFPDLKDRSSDSDSSAILNEDTSPHGAAISSTRTELLLSNGGHHHQNYPFMMSSSSSQSSMNCSLQISSDSSKSIFCDAQKAYQPSFVKIEGHNFFCYDESCNFFSDDQAPALHWYCPDQWT